MNRYIFCVYVMNLGNYQGDYFKISSLEDLAEAEMVVNPRGWNDIEVQLIECYFDCVTYSFDIFEFLKLKEEFNISPEELGYLFVNHTETEVREILENQVFYTIIEADTKLEAFKDYIKEFDMLEIPQHLESYIDYNSLLIDWECGGLTIHKVVQASSSVRNNKYLIINMY